MSRHQEFTGWIKGRDLWHIAIRSDWDDRMNSRSTACGTSVSTEWADTKPAGQHCTKCLIKAEQAWVRARETMLMLNTIGQGRS